LIAINSPNNIDPLLQTGCFSSVVSSSTNTIAPAEEEFQFHGLQADKSPPEYWRNLGSSKTRTKEQEIKGRDLILQKITETNLFSFLFSFLPLVNTSILMVIYAYQ
jgi:hypothetical protein